MFTIFGANGKTGSVVAGRLMDAGKKVRLVVRDPNKVAALRSRGAEVVTGDVTDTNAVKSGLTGAEGAYLLIPPDNQSKDLVARGRRIADSYLTGLTAAKVPHAVMLSSVGAQKPSGTGPIVMLHYAETTLPKAGATKLTFVRAAFFMENILANAYPMKQDGVLPVFGGGENHPFPMVATRDIGDVAADALLAPPSVTQWIELSGPREYSYADAAAAASKILGRTVKATPMPLDATVPTLTKLGFSENVAGLYREMIAAFGSGLGWEGKGRALRGKVPLEDVLRAGLA
jgi:uncharacterized protein YbjT (DUF2867 family)